MLDYSIPGNTEKIDFNQNSITNVHAGYFKNLPNIIEIHLYSNDIDKVDEWAFVEVASVSKIDLGYNQLMVIHENMLSGLQNLAWLSLQGNGIHTIEDRSFKDLTALTSLSLHYNSLKTIPQQMFNLDNLPTGLNPFYIRNNPLSCDQSLCWLKQADYTWITVGYREHTKCAEPQALKYRKWDEITATDLCYESPCGFQSKCSMGTDGNIYRFCQEIGHNQVLFAFLNT